MGFDLGSIISTVGSGLSGIGGVLGSALSAIPGLLNTGYNLYTNKRDFDYQKAIQKQIFEREDTAVQRRMEDLKAAGLNPNLAAGSSASAGAVVGRSTTNDVNMGAALDTMAAVSQIKAQQIQNNILKEEEDTARYNKLITKANYLANEYQKMYDIDFIKFLYADDWHNSDKLMKEYNPRLYNYFNNLLRDQTNSSDILQKQNNWFTANQWVNAITSGAGAVTGLTNAGSNAYKAANMIKRYR